MVHKEVICRRSPFFEAACAERWSQTDTSKDTELPEDDAGTFNTYLQYLYSGGEGAFASLGDHPSKTALRVSSKPALRVYLLADKLGDLTAANAVVDELIRNVDEGTTFPSAKNVSMVFDNTIPSSPIRRLLVDFWMHNTCPTFTEEHVEDMSPTFMCAVFNKLGQLKKDYHYSTLCNVFTQDVIKCNRCRYHQHNDEHPKYFICT